MSTTKTDRAFKTLINKRTTDENKRSFEEFGDNTINVNSNEIWVETIAYNDPDTSVSAGIVEKQTLLVLTEDTSVPSQQAWYAYKDSSRLKDWISDKYGSNFTVHLYDNNNSEIFPTDASEWFFDYQTGILTFDSDTSGHAQPYKLTGYRYIGRKGLTISTTGDITFEIDYEDPTAIDPGGVTFASQADVDAYLDANGATAIKHFQAAFESLPIIIEHEITFNLAAGTHRPRPEDESADAGWLISGKDFKEDGKIILAGSDTYDAYGSLSGLTIQSSAESSNPSMTFSGTPFAGLDLKGYFAVLSTGDVTTIHANTDNILYVTALFKPTVGATVTVGTPSTIYRDSLTDLAGSGIHTYGIMFSGNGSYQIQDILIDSWGAYLCHQLSFYNCGPTYQYSYRVMIDVLSYYDTLGVRGGPVQSAFYSYSSKVWITHLSFLCPPRNGHSDESSHYTWESYNSTIAVREGYIAGSDYGMYFDSNDCCSFLSCVFAEMGDIDGGSLGNHGGILQIYRKAVLDIVDFDGYWTHPGKRCEFRDMYARTTVDERFSVIALNDPGTEFGDYQFTGAIFTNCVDINAVLVGANALYRGGVYLDGGGNTGWGIYIEGPSASVNLNSGSTVTGTKGDIRLPTGDTVTHDWIQENGPVSDLSTIISPI